MNNVKPTFGVSVSGDNSNSPFRQEVGAIWTYSMKSNEKYLNLRFKLSKEKLKQILESSETEEISINFVAFPNKFAKEASNRPAFRIFEENNK